MAFSSVSVVRFQDPEDKGRTRVKITEEGTRGYEQLKSLRNDFNAQTYHIYNDQEIMVNRQLLDRTCSCMFGLF
jgi:DNA-binding MarR family transcriptional regulator